MQGEIRQALRRLAQHGPAGRQRIERPDHGLMGDGQAVAAVAADLGQQGPEPRPGPRAGSRRRARGNRGRGPRSSAIAGPSSARSSRRRRPSHSPKLISIRRGSTGASPWPSRAAVSRARSSGLVSQAKPATSARQPPAGDGLAALGRERQVGAALQAARRVQAVGPWRSKASSAIGQAPRGRLRRSASMQRPVEDRGRGGDVMAPAHLLGGGAPPWRPAGAGAIDQGAGSRGEGAGLARRRQQAGDRRRSTMEGTPPDAPGDHRQAGGLGLQQRHAIGLVDRGPEAEVGGGIEQPATLLLIEAAQIADPPGPERRQRRLDLRPRRAVADEQQLPVEIEQLPPGPRPAPGRRRACRPGASWRR